MRKLLLQGALKIAATRFGGWFFTTVTPPLDRWLLQFSSGRWNIGLGWVPICLLTTTGRNSGRTYQTPLLYMRDDRYLYLVASAGGNPRHPAWYLNARDREVQVTLSDMEIRAVAQEIPTARYPMVWQEFVAFNPGFEAYKQRVERHIPIIQVPLT